MQPRHLMGMIVTGVLACAVAGGCQQRRSNAELSADVRQELSRQQLPATITVAVVDGVAKLDGTVRDKQTREKAEDVAEDVKGVDHVVNNIRVATVAGDAPAAGHMPAPGYQLPESAPPPPPAD